MPLESGGRQKILSGETPHLRDDNPRNPVQPDHSELQPGRTGGQSPDLNPGAGQDPDLNLGAGREDINLGQDSRPQEQAYSSDEQRDVYQSQEQSFNEQRHNYAEKAFNSNPYNYEMVIEQVRTTTDGFRRVGHKDTGGGRLTPPPVPSTDLNPDSDLELSEWAQERMDLVGKQISRLEKEKTKNNRKREKLKEKQPSVQVHSKKADRVVEKKLSEREYEQKRRSEIRKSDRREQAAARVKRTGRLLFENGTEGEDEDTAAVKHEVHKHASAAKRRIKRNVRNIRDKGYVYKRLKFKDKKDKLISKEGKRLKHEQGRILALNRQMHESDRQSDRQSGKSIYESDQQSEKSMYKSDRQSDRLCGKSTAVRRTEGTGDGSEREAADRKEAARRAENRKIQQQKKQRQRIAHQQEHARNESIRNSHRYQHKMNKTSRKEQRIQRKRNRTIVSSIASIICTILIIVLLIVLFMMTFFSMFAHITTETVTQNDYTVLTDVTGYLRDMETELRKLVDGEGKEELEKDLDEECLAQTGQHVYEFIYSLPDFGFDDITLMAYLSAKFFEFNLEMVQADLDEIFSLMYRVETQFKEEERTFYDDDGNPYIQKVMVCYITVSKTELEEVVEARLDQEALELYNSYKLSGGGQQTYGPALDGIDWSGKISSAFGERVHPITGKKTFHDGVDIAIPTGTRLYSAVTGKVKEAYYSDSAGNMVTVQTESGWEVTYMHMDSLSVSAGQTVFRGQPVGFSGNTGNSTGPHLHIRVHDAEGRKINPVFIIPQSGYIYND